MRVVLVWGRLTEGDLAATCDGTLKRLLAPVTFDQTSASELLGSLAKSKERAHVNGPVVRPCALCELFGEMLIFS